jgi:hypothetical protein
MEGTERRSRKSQRTRIGVSANANAEIVGEAFRFASSKDRCKAGRFAYGSPRFADTPTLPFVVGSAAL